MGWIVRVYNTETGEDVYVSDEYDTRAEAEADLEETRDSMVAGAEYLSQLGRPYNDPDDLEYEIEET